MKTELAKIQRSQAAAQIVPFVGLCTWDSGNLCVSQDPLGIPDIIGSGSTLWNSSYPEESSASKLLLEVEI